jgi:hypothetical protein
MQNVTVSQPEKVMFSAVVIADLNSEITETKARIMGLQLFPSLLAMGENGKLALDMFVAGYRCRDIEALEERVNDEVKEEA